MARFSDVRATIIKRTDAHPGHSAATPRLLSPFKDVLQTKPREGVDLADILMPQRNRASRRSLGVVRRRHRISGVGIHPTRQPWKTGGVA